MSDLAAALGVSIPSVSTLELNDERGVAKSETVERALHALGLERWDAVLPSEQVRAIDAEAGAIAARVAWTMSLEAQDLPQHEVDAIVRRLVAARVANL